MDSAIGSRNFGLFQSLVGILFATAIVFALILYSGPGQAELQSDISDQVDVEFDPVKKGWKKKTYRATVVVTNASTAEIHGPVRIVITEFKNKRHQLKNADGVTEDGYPYLDIDLPDGVLGVGESTDQQSIVFQKMSGKKWKRWKKANKDEEPTPTGDDESPGWSEHDFPIKFTYLVNADAPPEVLTVSSPDAVPGAVRVGTGKVNVRFTVSAQTTGSEPIPILFLRKLNRDDDPDCDDDYDCCYDDDCGNNGHTDSPLNDDGVRGDLQAGDGIFTFVEMIDTDLLESGDCFSYVGVASSELGGTVESEESLLCATHFPIELFESVADDNKLRPFGDEDEPAEVLGNEVLVSVEPGASTDALEAFLGIIGGIVIGTQLEDGLHQVVFDRVRSGEELLELFELIKENVPEVTDVGPNYVGEFDSEPDDPEFPNQHALQLVSAESLDTEVRRYVWDAGATGAGVTVVILDSGVNDDLPDDLNPLGELAADTTDLLGHGTQMAGIIAAPAENATAIAPMARDVAIRSVRMSGNNKITLSKMLKGFKRAKGYAGRNVVVSASFSIKNMLSDGGVCNQINRTINRGAVVVVSAGNNNKAKDTGVVPAHCNSPAFNPFNTNGRVTGPNRASLIVVGASSCSAGPCDVDSRWTQSTNVGSNRGDWVDISAPGVDVQATSIDGLVSTTTGTSAATALVAGAAAILRGCDVGGSLSPTDPTGGATLELTLGDVFQAMITGATTPVSGNLPNRLNLYNALASVNTAPIGITLSNDQVVENTDTTDGFILGELGGLDDTACDAHEFEITGGADAAKFSIGGAQNNMLVIEDNDLAGNILDFESQAIYEVEITVNDFFGQSLSQPFTIVIIDEVEGIP